MESSEKLQHVLDDGSVFDLYNACFADPPYEEFYSEEKIRSLFLSYWEKGLLLFCFEREKKEIIGFAAAVPLKYETEISELSKSYGYDPFNDWYSADLGIKKGFRRKGIATQMVKSLIQYIPSKRLIMRTQENNVASQACHMKLGFRIIEGMEQDVSIERISGDVKVDKRIFLSYDKPDR